MSEVKNATSPETSEATPLFSVEELRVGFWSRGRWVQAVDGASVHLGHQEGLAVIGESGSGKTLTMMSSLALIPPNPGVIGGSIQYRDGDDQVSLLEGVNDAYDWTNGKCSENASTDRWRLAYQRRARYLAGLKIGIIFQNPISSLDPLFSVGGTLVESVLLRNPSLSKKEAYEEAVDWLDRVHIKNPTGVMRSYPHQLSGGMCQRVMIAATLSMHPRIIIADEPTTGLDMTTKAQILFLLHEAREKYGSSLIFVTHEIGLVTGLTERVVVMRSGNVVDRFPTSHLSGVSRVDGALNTTHSFATHTNELLTASLKLEGDSSIEGPEKSGGLVDSEDTENVESSESTESHEETSAAPVHKSITSSTQEKEQILAWQKQQTHRILGAAGASVVLSGLAAWVRPGWVFLCLLLVTWLYTLLRSGYIVETIDKHQMGQDLLQKLSWTRWLSYCLPCIVIVLYLWSSGSLGRLFS